MANEFTVAPAGDFSQGLTGLGSILQETSDRKRELDAIAKANQRKTDMANEFTQALHSGDPMRVVEVGAKYPEIAENAHKAAGFIEDQHRKDADQFATAALASPDQLPSLAAGRIAQLKASGQDTMQAEQFYQLAQQNPQQALDRVKMGLAISNPAAYKDWAESQKPVDVAAGGTLVNPQSGKVIFAADRPPESPLGKLADDLKKGRITQAEFDDEKRKMTALSAAAQQQADAAAFDQKTANLTGQDFLAALTPARAATAKAVADGKLKLTDVSYKDRSQAAADVMRYTNGNYDEPTALGRYAAVKSWLGGPDGKLIDPINTTMQHIDLLKQATDALKNGQIPVANKILNQLGIEAGKDPQTTANLIGDFAAGELVRATTGAAGALEDRKRMRDSLNMNGSPNQIAAGLNAAHGLLAGRLGSYEKRYQAQTGFNDFADRFLTGAARDEFEKMKTIDQPAEQGAPAGGKYPEGTVIKNPTTGQKMVMKGGTWQPM